MTIKVALMGNPNVGKTSLFNALTGARQHVANWPGVTVEKREGTVLYKGFRIHVVDLPGIYTFGSKSIDEQIARDYILFEAPDVVVVVADAVNPEQGLYLLMQVLELRADVILVMNAVDELEKSGAQLDRYELEKHLGVHVIPTVATKRQGVSELLNTIVHVFKSKPVHLPVKFRYDEEVEKRINELEEESSSKCENLNVPTRWLAIRLIEGDDVVKWFCDIPFQLNEEEKKRLGLLIAKSRYDHINMIIREAYSGGLSSKRLPLDEAIDHVLTHKYLGIPIFFAIMYLIFSFTFEVAQPLADGIDASIAYLAELVKASLGENWFSSLLADGIISGVGAVLVFTPNIFVMFLGLGVLEETGYLPRAAFVIDRVMYALKLSGRSFMSLILGFGCNVPSILSTRAISDPRERLVTILVSPFVTCSARLPVYILLAGLFFPKHAGSMLFLMYSASIILAALSSVLLNKVLFKGEPVPLIMELPRYRKPTVLGLLNYSWSKGRHFLQKAGTIILAASVAIWFLGSFPPGDIENTFAARLGKFLEPIFKPLGYDWRTTTALIFGMAAKEIMVSTFSTFYSTEGVEFTEAMRNAMDPATALSLMFFVLTYIPCFATIAAIRSETQSSKWTAVSILYGLVIAYGLAYLVKVVIGGWVGT